MKIKISFFVFCICLGFSAFSQNTIIGKWRVAYFNLDNLIKGDTRVDTFYIADSLEVMVKDINDDPAISNKKVLKIMAEMMLEEFKEATEEYTTTGKYIETNSSKKIETGTYNFNTTNNLLTRKIGKNEETFVVSYKNGNLVLSGETVNDFGDKVILEIEYERL